MGKFHIGETKMGTTYDMYNLIRKKSDDVGGDRSDEISSRENSNGKCALVKNHAKTNIDLGEPPNTNSHTKTKYNFTF